MHHAAYRWTLEKAERPRRPQRPHRASTFIPAKHRSMSRTCTVCASPHRSEIDRALSTASNRVIARQYSVGRMPCFATGRRAPSPSCSDACAPASFGSNISSTIFSMRANSPSAECTNASNAMPTRMPRAGAGSFAAATSSSADSPASTARVARRSRTRSSTSSAYVQRRAREARSRHRIRQ